MTSSIKSPLEPAGPTKPAGSPRANAVCLELNVTLRSLPGEAGSQAQPIREDLRTVIVFDNGAVLRSTNDLPAGLTLILSNAKRDVVCRVVTGRSMPAVKGYVEIEFIEPVKDFWGIHQESAPAPAPVAPSTPQPAPTPAAVAPPASPVSPIQRQAPVPLPRVPQVTPPPPPPPVVSRSRVPQDLPTAASLAGPVEFDEFPGPMNPSSSPERARESKPEFSAPPSISSISSRVAAEEPSRDFERPKVTSPTPVATWTAPALELEATATRPPALPAGDGMSAAASAPAGHDFMSKGLMAYEQPAAAAGSTGRTPTIVGLAALALAVVGGLVFFTHHGSSAAPVAKAAPMSEMAAAQPATINNPPTPVGPARQAEPIEPAQTESQLQAKTIAAAQPLQPETAVAPIPAAEIAKSSSPDSRTDASSAHKQDKPQSADKRPEASTSKRPMLSNLKIGAPSAPRKNLADGGDAPAPMTVASSEIPAGSTPANLLTSPSGTTGLPAPPVEAPPPPAVKPATDPKLISSTRPLYPQTARQANIDGSVTLMIYIDQTGKVFSARALTGPVMLRAAAEDAVKLWKYAPAQEDGKPVQSHVIVKVDFKLN